MRNWTPGFPWAKTIRGLEPSALTIMMSDGGKAVRMSSGSKAAAGEWT